MTKFKSGDTVVCVANDGFERHLTVGKTYRISEVLYHPKKYELYNIESGDDGKPLCHVANFRFKLEGENNADWRVEGMCCDCLQEGSHSICGDFSENDACEFKKEDGSCWK